MNYLDTEVLRKIHTDNEVLIEGYDGELLITKKSIGDIYLPTGEIVVFDPEKRYVDFLMKKEPLVDKVAPGSYKVKVYYAFNKTERRIAFAEIVFDDVIPEKYIPALNTVDKYAKVKPGKEFGFTIFSKCASYADIETLKIFNDMLIEKAGKFTSNFKKTSLINFVVSQFRDTNDYGFCRKKIDNEGHNVITFEVTNCNFCPSFWGIDKEGNKCCLVTDFLLHK